MPRSMPVYQVQLKSTARRSFASFAGVYGGCWLPPNCACKPDARSALAANASTTENFLVIGVAGRQGDRLQEPERAAVARRDELRRNRIPGLEHVRTLADAPLRERRRRAG